MHGSLEAIYNVQIDDTNVSWPNPFFCGYVFYSVVNAFHYITNQLYIYICTFVCTFKVIIAQLNLWITDDDAFVRSTDCKVI